MSDIVERAKQLLTIDTTLSLTDQADRMVDILHTTRSLITEVESLRTELKWVTA